MENLLEILKSRENVQEVQENKINWSEILDHISDGEHKVYLKTGKDSDWKLMFNYKPTVEEYKLIHKTSHSQEELLAIKEIQSKYIVDLEEKDLNVVNTFLNYLWELLDLDSSELDFEGRIVATSSNAHTKLSYKQKNETEYKIIKL
jgi:hypothetical protein